MSKISIIPTAKAKRSPETISILKELLEMAEAGDVLEVFAMVFHKNGDQGTYISSMINTLQKIGALEQLKFDLMNERKT